MEYEPSFGFCGADEAVEGGACFDLNIEGDASAAYCEPAGIDPLATLLAADPAILSLLKFCDRVETPSENSLNDANLASFASRTCVSSFALPTILILFSAFRLGGTLKEFLVDEVLENELLMDPFLGL